MKHSHKTLIALLSLASAGAFAQTPGTNTPRVDQREANQQARIASGAANGSLTPHETQRLEKEQARIDNAEAKAKADGTVTAQERRRLHVMQDGASRDIHRKRNNNRAAGTPG
ncbi:hypothetical protein [Pelomonas cellulosilytica]|uniref:DUF4148 domain-containing protein n=1 Tax=Pelomonas cellulosilytica TaxID=2906762 RepID=A0ABS8XZ51_9BURK|nr:hypothetical protein [Pelomonas sp. P8]MCE4557122.1 hypothetical protein [Pelomonas sp. P8]